MSEITKFVKVTIENEKGKYKFYLTEMQLLTCFDQSEPLNSTIVDAKNGREYIIANDAKDILKIVPPKIINS